MKDNASKKWQIVIYYSYKGDSKNRAESKGFAGGKPTIEDREENDMEDILKGVKIGTILTKDDKKETKKIIAIVLSVIAAVAAIAGAAYAVYRFVNRDYYDDFEDDFDDLFEDDDDTDESDFED